MCRLARIMIASGVICARKYNNNYLTDKRPTETSFRRAAFRYVCIVQIQEGAKKVTMRELCPNNVGNNDGAKELSILPEF